MHDTEERARSQLEIEYDVSRETIEALGRYHLLLDKWSKQINLVGPSTLKQFWSRHVLDCAQLLPVAGPSVSTIADFGSGAGLPGLILATILKDRRSDSLITLIDVSAKRCAFLREAARVLDVKVQIQHQKIQDVDIFPVDLVTARAFAPLEKLLGYSHPWAMQGARLVFPKGEDVQREIDEASTNWSFQSKITLSVTDSRGCIIEILDLKRLEGT